MNDLGVRSQHFSGHEAVTNALTSGRYAAGAANTNLLSNPNFTVLKFLETDVRMPWVAKSGIDSRMFAALQHAFLALHDANILQKIETNLTGFQKVADSDYNHLREQMRQSLEFGEIK